MTSLGDIISSSVHTRFEALPAKSKPVDSTDGVRGWVPLSGIAFTRADEKDVECVILAKINQINGCVLHDWHAEVLAIRGFNLFLIQECYKLASSETSTSPYIRRRDKTEISETHCPQPFTLRESLKVHMYCSEAPCGDASMELVKENQADDTPWPLPNQVSNRNSPASLLNGRGYFSQLGVVRRKPSRSDSPPTLSKSCSDKLALKQCTSLLSSLASLLIFPENVYLDKLILPSSQYVPSACERSFGPSGRMVSATQTNWKGGYKYRPFEVICTDNEFGYSKRRSRIEPLPPKGSNISTLWTPRLHETMINGVLQGRKQTDPRGATSVCRMKIWRAVLDVAALLALPAIYKAVSSHRYRAIKQAALLENHRRVKEEVKREALVGWIDNVEDDFGLKQA